MKDKKISILDKMLDYSLERTFEEQEKILNYKKKAIGLLEEIFEEKINDKKFLLMSEDLQPELMKIGYLLEKNESIEDFHDLKENEGKIDKLIAGIAEKLDLKFNKEPEVVLIDESLIEQELINKSKLEGSHKEAILEGSFQNENGQVASSLVVNLTPEKIKETISTINDKLNPINKYPAPKFNHKKEAKKDIDRQRFESIYVNNFIMKQDKGIVIDTETFSYVKTEVKLGSVFLNVQGIREKSLGLSSDKPDAVMGGSGLITERRKLTS